MIKRNAAKPVRVAPPMMEEQEVSTSTLQELLEKEETVSNLIFSKGREEGISKSYKSFKNCTFRNQTFSECKFRSSQLADIRFENCDLSNISFCRKLPLPGRVHCLQITRNQPFRDDHESCFIA